MDQDNHQERRRETRNREALPVTIERDRGERFGVTRNMSVGGLLVNTPSRLEPGEQVDVAVHDVRGISRRRAVVVRRTWATDLDPWRYRVALRFSA